ncbi:MAG TPA: hypothetical protein VE777_18455, partial [Gaiellales bacterium]|nr:hypothetical protein [Gaiellales bacterium]
PPSLGQLRPGTLPPLQYRRLAVLGAIILGLVIILVFLARGCSGSSAQAKNRDYFDKLQQTALGPAGEVATKFHKTLNLPRGKLRLLRSRFASQRTAMEAAVKQAAAVAAPKQLQSYQPYLIQALRYRVTGLECMEQHIAQAWQARRAAAAGQLLAPCAARLLASDVIYTDSFSTPATAALKGLGVQVPTSTFLSGSDVELATQAGMGQTIARLKPSAAHGLHGLGLISVVAAPQGTTLIEGSTTVNKIKGDQNLDIVVTAKNQGHFREVSVPVKLELTRSGSKAITRTGTIASIDPGKTAEVHFGDLFANSATQPEFTNRYKMTVTVEKVPGEHTLTNNSKSFVVQFVLPT